MVTVGIQTTAQSACAACINITIGGTRVPNESKPIRVQAEVHETFIKRAAALAAERGIPEIKLPAYLAEASKFFEDHRPKVAK